MAKGLMSFLILQHSITPAVISGTFDNRRITFL
jgi:hypothetical protein